MGWEHQMSDVSRRPKVRPEKTWEAERRGWPASMAVAIGAAAPLDPERVSIPGYRGSSTSQDYYSDHYIPLRAGS